jgi:hypothetical protein
MEQKQGRQRPQTASPSEAVYGLKVFWHPLGSGVQGRQLLGVKRLVETA